MSPKEPLKLVHKSLKNWPILEPKLENQFPTSVNQLPRLVPKLSKNLPIPSRVSLKPCLNPSQKLEKKSFTLVTSSLILSGIELIAFQILSSTLEELDPLSSLPPVVFPPLVLFPSVAPPELVELPEKPL